MKRLAIAPRAPAHPPPRAALSTPRRKPPRRSLPATSISRQITRLTARSRRRASRRFPRIATHGRWCTGVGRTCRPSAYTRRRIRRRPIAATSFSSATPFRRGGALSPSIRRRPLRTINRCCSSSTTASRLPLALLGGLHLAEHREERQVVGDLDRARGDQRPAEGRGAQHPTGEKRARRRGEAPR